MSTTQDKHFGIPEIIIQWFRVFFCFYYASLFEILSRKSVPRHCDDDNDELEVLPRHCDNDNDEIKVLPRHCDNDNDELEVLPRHCDDDNDEIKVLPRHCDDDNDEIEVKIKVSQAEEKNRKQSS